MGDYFLIMLQVKKNKWHELNNFLDKLSIEEYYEYEYGLYIKRIHDNNLSFVSFYPFQLKVLEEEIEELETKIKEEVLANIKEEIKELAKKYSDNLKVK